MALNRRICIPALLLTAVVSSSLAGCGGRVPNGDLFYVLSGSSCPGFAPEGMNLDNPAGFTSRQVAIKVAATETAGIDVYWNQRIKLLRSEVAGTKPAPVPRPTLIADLETAQVDRRIFVPCVRIVKRGQPPTPIATGNY